MKQKVKNLVEALLKAKKAAEEFSNIEDGGTCNFDTCIIKLHRWAKNDIEAAEQESGVSIGDQLSGWHKGYRFLNDLCKGQAHRRTKMAEAAKKSLQADGYEVSVYYQMD